MTAFLISRCPSRYLNIVEFHQCLDKHKQELSNYTFESFFFYHGLEAFELRLPLGHHLNQFKAEGSGSQKKIQLKLDHTGIAEVRVRIPASLIFSGFLFATA